MTPFEFFIYAIATMRLARMIACESGPSRIFARLRELPNKTSSYNEGLNCVYCVSVWVATLMAAFVAFSKFLPAVVLAIGWFVIFILAISGGGMLLSQTVTYLRRE